MKSVETLLAEYEQQQVELNRALEVFASAPESTIVDADALERLQAAFAAIERCANPNLIPGVRI